MSNYRITAEGFVKIEISHAMICRAYEKRDEISSRGAVNNKTFHTKDKMISFLGEECFASTFKNAERRSSATHDFFLEGKTIDVKTKFRNCKPQLNFVGSVPAYQLSKDVFCYVFMSIYKENETLICHMCSKVEQSYFRRYAKFWKTGSVDSSNNLKFKADSFSMEYKEMARW